MWHSCEQYGWEIARVAEAVTPALRWPEGMTVSVNTARIVTARGDYGDNSGEREREREGGGREGEGERANGRESKAVVVRQQCV